MTRFLIALACALLMGAPMIDALAAPVLPAQIDLTVADLPAGPCIPHPAIDVQGDTGPSGLLLGYAPDGTPLYRPGSGVTSGSGTVADPLVIARLCLVGDAETPAVRIVDVTLALALRELNIQPSTTTGAVTLSNVAEVEIRQIPSADEVSIQDARTVTIEGTVADEIEVIRADRVIGDAVVSDRLLVKEAGSVEVRDSRLTLDVIDAAHVTVERHMGQVDLDLVQGFIARNVTTSHFEVTRSARGTVTDLSTEQIWTSNNHNLTFERFRVHGGNVYLSKLNDSALREGVIAGDSATFPLYYGISLVGSRNVIERIEVRNATRGAILDGGGHNVIQDNVFSTTRGIEIEESTENVIDRNLLPEQGILFEEKTSGAFSQRIGAQNTEAGVALRYVRDARNTVISGGEGRLIVAKSANVTVADQEWPLLIAHSTLMDVTRNAVPVHAVWVTASRFHHNDHGGSGSLFLEASRSNVIERNHVEAVGSDCVAIRLYGSPINFLQNNTINGCATGLLIENSQQVAIRLNNVSNASEYGIYGWLAADRSHVHLNNVMHNAVGIHLHQSSDVEVYRNNFWANAKAVGASGNANVRDNWWGCPTGPRTAGCDPLDPQISLFTPWRSSPVFDAGVR